jgi:hypothetical protein
MTKANRAVGTVQIRLGEFSEATRRRFAETLGRIIAEQVVADQLAGRRDDPAAVQR